MIPIKELLKDIDAPNPFSDSNARSYSDKKLLNEFYPTSAFWSLFNDQHEVLLGSRGSGKSFLLKMMRYSLLMQIEDPIAKKIVSEKNYLALYVPMHLEFITHFIKKTNSEEENIHLFTFCFNCLLAISLIKEIQAVIEVIYTENEKRNVIFEVVDYLNTMWFGENSGIKYDLISLKAKVRKLYYDTDLRYIKSGEDSRIFTQQICSPLTVVKEFVSNKFGFYEEPTWIICVDEAEFLNVTAQKCINNLFRSDSSRITIKMATMHYKHVTLETLAEEIPVSVGNDFVYRVIDLDYESNDFIRLSDSICANRLNQRLLLEKKFTQLEDLVETIFKVESNGNKKENLIDYYRKEVGEDTANSEVIKEDLLSQLDYKSREKANNSSNFRKAYYDKYLPILMTRKMYEINNKGHSSPGWYSGASMVRRLSQGNPRMYLEILNKLFEESRKKNLKLKAQHSVLLKYSEEFINSTQALPEVGPKIHNHLERIAKALKDDTHGSTLKYTGSFFTLIFNEGEFEEAKKWLELAIGYSKVKVDNEALTNGLKFDTRYRLSNTYSAYYWLPMRSGNPKKINYSQNNIETVKLFDNDSDYQLKMF